MSDSWFIGGGRAVQTIDVPSRLFGQSTSQRMAKYGFERFRTRIQLNLFFDHVRLYFISTRWQPTTRLLWIRARIQLYSSTMRRLYFTSTSRWKSLEPSNINLFYSLYMESLGSRLPYWICHHFAVFRILIRCNHFLQLVLVSLYLGSGKKAQIFTLESSLTIQHSNKSEHRIMGS